MSFSVAFYSLGVKLFNLLILKVRGSINAWGLKLYISLLTGESRKKCIQENKIPQLTLTHFWSNLTYYTHLFSHKVHTMHIHARIARREC